MTPKAWAALLGVGGIWGASFLFIRVSVEEVSPLQTVLFRTVGGACILAGVLTVRRQAVSFTPRLLLTLCLLSVISTVAPLLLISWAETRIDSGTAAILNALMPIFTLLIAAAVLAEERLAPRALAGVALGVAGVALLSGRGPGGLLGSSFVAELAVILATACFAVGNVMVRFLVRSLPGIVISAAQISISAALTLAASLAFDPPRLDLSWDVWGSLAALAFLSTGFAYIGYYWLIEHAGSFRASLVTYVIPVVGVALGAAVLDERVTLATVAGGTLIAAGVAIGTGSLEAFLPSRIRNRRPESARCRAAPKA